MAARRDRTLAHHQGLAALPYRGSFGAPRPRALDGLALPPDAMPPRDRLRPFKAWRYVGVFGPDIMLCLGSVRVGPLHQSFWGLWDRADRRLEERTLIGRRQVRLACGRAEVRSAEMQIELELDETPGVETVSRSGSSYIWTRKQGGVPARGVVVIAGRHREVHARAVIDDSAGYHERHTRWRWCAGVGSAGDGRRVAWNLVDGVHDAPSNSERTVWVNDEPHEVPPETWNGLRFHPEAERVRRDNLLVVRSAYRQPFGTFSGELAGLSLAVGYGVTEAHEAWW